MLLFFDFDLTLTENHSRGFPIENINFIFNSKKVETYVLNIISHLLLKHIVYIVSQGNQEQIKKYLELNGINDVIVFGSSDINRIYDPNWKTIKSTYIKSEISKYEKDVLHIFLDDDLKNINEAKMNGIYSLQAFPGEPIKNLTYILEIIDKL